MNIFIKIEPQINADERRFIDPFLSVHGHIGPLQRRDSGSLYLRLNKATGGV